MAAEVHVPLLEDLRNLEKTANIPPVPQCSPQPQLVPAGMLEIIGAPPNIPPLRLDHAQTHEPSQHNTQHQINRLPPWRTWSPDPGFTSGAHTSLISTSPSLPHALSTAIGSTLQPIMYSGTRQLCEQSGVTAPTTSGVTLAHYLVHLAPAYAVTAPTPPRMHHRVPSRAHQVPEATPPAAVTGELIAPHAPMVPATNSTPWQPAPCFTPPNIPTAPNTALLPNERQMSSTLTNLNLIGPGNFDGQSYPIFIPQHPTSTSTSSSARGASSQAGAVVRQRLLLADRAREGVPASRHGRHCMRCLRDDCGGRQKWSNCKRPCHDCGSLSCRGRNSARKDKPCQEAWR
ncbi:hypothetical protein FA13DRAFT_1725491 [Coprinellus micaceus]|uniref:Uncharacterized protein n=1 Tax=Coprinellus micaceus TaxID=71717 RepID=A0A4Y7TUN6_COPMI|nr:hypothetical protein FA13DRAFT_1725491 [Coprinellus micaceus]